MRTSCSSRDGLSARFASGAGCGQPPLIAASAVEGGLVVDAEPEAVGRAALDGRVVLSHLGPSEGAGLERLFFDLTTLWRILKGEVR